MPLIRTEAIILQSRKFSETSKIISAFTKDKGRVRILVKGGRKGSKKFPGGLETLNWVDLQFYYRSGRELQNFKLADLIKGYQTLRKDLKLTCTALSLAETIERTTPPDDANPILFNILAQSLAALDSIALNPWTIRWNSLLRIGRALGFGMSLQACRRCGVQGPMRSFDLAGGGFICAKCHRANAPEVAVVGQMWGILRFLDSCSPEVAPRMMVSPEIGKRIEALFLLYYKYHVPGLRGFSTWRTLPQTYWGELPEGEVEKKDG